MHKKKPTQQNGAHLFFAVLGMNSQNQSYFSTNTSFRLDDLQNSSMVISDDEATQHLHSIRDTLHSKDLMIEKLRQYLHVLQREYETKEEDYTRQGLLLLMRYFLQ